MRSTVGNWRTVRFSEPRKSSDPVEVEAPFARYEVRASVDGRTLRVVRRFVARGTTMAPEQYAHVRRFAQRVAEADRAQAVLVRE